MKKLLFLSLIFSQMAFAKNYLDENVTKYQWNGVDVIFLEDNQYPTYNISIYFADGALGDQKGKEGTTEMMFSLLDSGTTRYTQKEISDALEFYGISKSYSVTHEYSSFTVTGLAKDALPTMKMVCHLFQNVTYPVAEMKKYKVRHESYLKSMVTRHSDLANRIFRELTLKDTSFDTPVDGKISSVKRIYQSDLSKRLDRFNNETLKRIYIKGPKRLSLLENVFTNDCKWSGKATKTANYPTEVKPSPSVKKANTVYLVTVPNANQAQIRIGRILTTKEATSNLDQKVYASTFIGGGFTSRLMQELRVKRGLTYSVGAYASSQRTYGRSGISTFSKNATVGASLKVIEKTLEDNSKEIDETFYQMSQNYILGNYLFSLESSTAFLGQLIYFDHIGRNYVEIYDFPETIKKTTKLDLATEIKSLFNWDSQTILIVGDKSLEKSLGESGYKVIKLNLNNYL